MSKTSSLAAVKIVAAIGEAAHRWCNPDFAARRNTRAQITERTGYTVPVVEHALDCLFVSLTSSTIERAIAEELGSLEVLDDFVGLRRAYPIGKVVIVSSRTTIGVAIVPAVYALCAKCTVLVKDREDSLVAAFFSTLSEILPEIAPFASARAWAGRDPQTDHELRLADAVVVFGSDHSLSTIRRALRPGVRFIGHGSRASIGYISRDALESEATARALANAAARDLILYDSEGCMSLHALFIERGGKFSPQDLAQLLVFAAQRVSVQFPIGRLDPRIAAYYTAASYRAAQGQGSVLRTPAGDTMVVVDPPLGEPPPFLPRTLPIYAIDGPEECEEYVRSHGLPLEAFAVVRPVRPLVELAARLGAVRIARFGEMQAPSPALHHGGRSRIEDFVRWVDLDGTSP
jgi:hypothetical protein